MVFELASDRNGCVRQRNKTIIVIIMSAHDWNSIFRNKHFADSALSFVGIRQETVSS